MVLLLAVFGWRKSAVGGGGGGEKRLTEPSVNQRLCTRHHSVCLASVMEVHDLALVFFARSWSFFFISGLLIGAVAFPFSSSRLFFFFFFFC